MSSCSGTKLRSSLLPPLASSINITEWGGCSHDDSFDVVTLWYFSILALSPHARAAKRQLDPEAQFRAVPRVL